MLKEVVENKECEIEWVETAEQLSDCLTKHMVAHRLLAVRTGTGTGTSWEDWDAEPRLTTSYIPSTTPTNTHSYTDTHTHSFCPILAGI